MPKIEDYALLGDLHTAALVSTAGSIDWLCLPRFDSPAAFAALLHNDQAGHWRLAPARASTATARRYAGNTLVLETDWTTADGAVRVIDFMPPRADTPHVVRIAVGLSGEVSMRSVLRLRFDYGRVVPWVRHHGARVDAIAGPDSVRLLSAVPVQVPAPAGASRQCPASSLCSSAANAAGESNRGKHSQSIDPAVLTRAAV